MNPTAKEICYRRMFCSSFWSLFVQSVLIGIFLFIININFGNPVNWIQIWINYLLDWRTWLYFFPLAAVITAQGIVCAKDYTSLQPFYPTRFTLTLQLLSLHNITVCFLHIFIGYSTAWLYISLSDGPLSSFTLPNDKFNEERLFLLYGGVWVNLNYFLKNYFSGSNYLLFPVVQQPKFAQIKSQLLSTIKCSIPQVLIPNLLYISFYFFYGGAIRQLYCSILDLQPDDVPIDSFEGIINVWLYAYLWIITIIVISSMKLMEFLFRIYLTEREVFPISNSMLTPGTLTLEEALKLKEFPFIHHLAFLDLFMLSEGSQTRRAHIFTLSQPGGHPHTWNAIKQECFLIIESFSAALSDLLIFRQKKDVPKETYNRYGVPINPNSPPRPQARKATFFDLFASKFSSHMENVYRWLQLRMTWWYNLPIIAYLFGDRKDLKIKYTLKLSQPVLWACHSLSQLCAHSLVEDNYGIIQNDLPKVICSLLKLSQTLESVDKHISRTPVDPYATSKQQHDPNNSSITAYALDKSVKRSIYRISNAFKNYISDLQLPRDAEIQMISYAEFKV